LDRKMLHVRFLEGTEPRKFSLPRRYTLTHSDRSGEMFLTVGDDYCHEQVSGWYTRFMRDEVLAEWKELDEGFEMHVYCHVSGGLVFGTPRMRLSIFRMHMRTVLEAVRQSDGGIFEERPDLDESMVVVHFCYQVKELDLQERYGLLHQYR